MTGGSGQKAMDQLPAGINRGKGPAGRYEHGEQLGFPDLDVFTSEAIDRIKAIAGDDSARAARLSALILEIAHREFAIPVLPDLVDEAAAQLDLAYAEPRRDGADAQPYIAQSSIEHAMAQAGNKLSLHEGMPPTEPVDRLRPDSVQQTPHARPGVSASRPRRRARSASLAIGVVLVAAGAAGALAYTGHLDTLDFGEMRETATSRIAAIGLAQLGGRQQTGTSGDAEASSPSPRAAETEPPGGSAVSGDAAGLEDESEGDGRNEGVADERNNARNGGPADGAEGDPASGRDEAVVIGNPGWEEDWRADEAALAERWPELEEAAEEAIKQRFREVREQAAEARQVLEAIGQEMNQLHRRQHEEMRVRHARERAEADAEGAGAVEQVDDRHQRERAALERDQKAERDRLAETHDELDRYLERARRDVARAREEAVDSEAGDRQAISGLHLQEQLGVREQPSSVTSQQNPTASLKAGDSAAAESGLQSQSGQPLSNQAQSDQPQDRRQQAPTIIEDSNGEDSNGEESNGEESNGSPGEDPGAIVVAPGPAEPQPEPLVSPQQAPPEPVMAAELQRNTEEAAPPAGQPPPPPSSPPAEMRQDAATAEDGAVGRAEAAESMKLETAKAAAPAGEPASEPPRGAAPVSQDVADLVERGNTLLDLGDLASARLFYRLAAGRGSAEGAMLMGMTFDPVYFSGAGIHGAQPQIQEALEWYGKAIAMGSQPAETRMGHLRTWLEQSAAAGNAQAEAALQQLR